jgi:diacylglycerol kinase (ATP)
VIRIVANPAAGGYSASLAAAVRRRCRGSTVDLVVVVGGDGTVGAVAPRVGSTPLSIVPAGTANSCYRTLWGATPWQVALDRALAGLPPTWVDLARITELDRCALSGVCTGFPAQAIHLAKSRGVPYTSALHDLARRYEPYPGRVIVDGVVVHSGPTMLANVGGARYRGGVYELLPHSRLADGLLDVCVLGGEHDIGEMLTLTRMGSHVDVPGVVYARGRRIRVERLDAPLWFEHDGEVLERSRSAFTLEAVPSAVPVIAAPDARAVAA